MKKTLFLFFISLFSLSFLSSCSDSSTFSEQLKAEKKLIQDYIKRNNIKVLDKFPEDSVSFRENEYVKLPSGLFFRLEKEGKFENVERGDRVTPLYREYTLDENPEMTDYWDPLVHKYPKDFVYMQQDQSCLAFQEAVSYMKKSESEAKLIVPSKLGFTKEVLVPYAYHLKIQFRNDNIETED